jgi:hypothetical protein
LVILSLGSPPIPIVRGPFEFTAVLPALPPPDQVALFLPPEYRLVLYGVELQSPGFWDFLGQLNLLETIRLMFNDYDENQRRKKYKNSAEARKLSLENQILENAVLKGKNRECQGGRIV